jgi:RNA polymerase sigma-70 factor (ECF subfamily)
LNRNRHSAIKEASDQELLLQYKQTNDLAVLGALYGRYMHLVYGVALKYLKEKTSAQDATMLIFEELVDKVRNHEIDNFKSWLHVLTRNHCLMYLRSRDYKNAAHVVDIDAVRMENEQLMHHHIDEPKLEEQITKLEHCIERLKDEQKTCVELFYLQQKSYKEIELHTELPIKKVKSHIQNGKRNLKICIEQRE